MGLYYKIAEVEGRQVLLFSNNKKRLKQYAEEHKEEFDFHNRIRKGEQVVVAEPENGGNLSVFDEPVEVDQHTKEDEEGGILSKVGL